MSCNRKMIEFLVFSKKNEATLQKNITWTKKSRKGTHKWKINVLLHSYLLKCARLL